VRVEVVSPGEDPSPEARLVGRSRELAQLYALLARAREGASGVLAIVGEPGSGKSALLAGLAAAASGCTVLRASGSELERGLAFAGVSGLLRPLMGRVDELPAAQRDSLLGALVVRDGPPVDRFSAYVGVFGLIAAAAERQPVLVIVDDLHWLDPASAEAVIFLARRLEAERVLLVIASRAENLELIRGLPRMDLAGVDLGDVDDLLRRGAGVVLTPDVALALHASTSGNPLALLEASRLLDEEQRSGRRPLPDPIPVGRQLADTYKRRFLELPTLTQRALVIASACDTGSVTVLAAALSTAGLQFSDLEPAEDASLLSVAEGRVRFTHPLIRSAAYHGATATDRRAAHRVLAEVSGAPERQEARAWHLVAASAGPDEAAATDIEELARKAWARHAPAVASSAFEAAARLTADPAVAAGRLLQAALAAQVSGHAGDAIALAQQAQAGTADPAIVGPAMQIEARLGFWAGTPGAAAMMEKAAYLIGEADPAAGGVALVEAAMSAGYEHVSGALAIIEHSLFAQAPELLRRLTIAAARLNQQTWQEVRADLIDMLPTMQALDPLANPWIAASYGRGLVITECWPEARELYTSIVGVTRRAGAIAELPISLCSLAEVDFRTDRWWHAYAAADEAVRIAEDTGGPRGWSLALLALTEAGQGREEECVAHASEAVEMATATGDRALRLWARSALGLLEQGQGRPRAALAHFRAQLDDYERSGLIQQPIWALERAEAQIRSGLVDEAETTLDAMRAMDLSGNPDDRIRLHRCEGLLATDRDCAGHFEAALAITGDSPFDRARTQLAYGERLRRTRRRAAASVQLQSALATFTNLGAAGWIAQTEREVQAAGDRLTAPKRATLSVLSARELQVAHVVATGASNREVAQTLFLSEKTVESHLRRCFQKLDIRSRVELARMLIQRENVA
jgi:DNA-binding CsgD family transcriptional regulator/tetratricopeptide (TPR) repeat protein